MVELKATYGSGAWWRRRLFGPGRIPFTIIEFLAFLGAYPSFMGIYTFVHERTKTPATAVFNCYLWLTFATSSIFVAAYLLLFKKVHIDLKEKDEALKAALAEQEELAADARDERKQEVSTREDAIKIQHRMAEEVRKCAALGAAYDCERELQRVFEGVRAYLRRRLGDEAGAYAITIKQLHNERVTDAPNGATPAPPQAALGVIFRDGSQNRDERRGGDTHPAMHSHVFASFTAETDNPRRWVLCQDVQDLPGSEKSYKDRASQANFRSIVAFPLRNPVLPVGGSAQFMRIKVANLFGFLSIDAPTPYAFEKLFVPRAGVERRNDGSNLDACEDVELFYGLADSIAAILVLKRNAEPKERTNGSDHPNHS